MKDSINLLPPKGKAQKAAEQKSQQQKIIIGAVLAVALLSWVVAFGVLQYEEQKERAVLAKIDQAQSNIKRFALLEQTYRNVYAKTQAAMTVLAGQQAMIKNVNDLRGTVLPNITLTQLTFDTEKVSMSVGSTDTHAVFTYLDNIEDEKGIQKIIKNLNLNSISLDKTTGYAIKVEGAIASGNK